MINQIEPWINEDETGENLAFATGQDYNDSTTSYLGSLLQQKLKSWDDFCIRDKVSKKNGIRNSETLDDLNKNLQNCKR